MKFMNMKRFGATVMAGVMTLSLAVPAFASSPSTVIEGGYNPVTVAVTVPKTGKAVINPYGLPIELDETTSISGEKVTTAAPLLIENRSKVAMKVTAKVTGVVKDGSDLVLIDHTATLSTTAKNVQAQFEAFEALGVTEANFSDTETINPMFAELDSADAKLTADVTTTETGTGASQTLILREGNADGEMQNGGAAFFRLSGDVTEDPTDAWDKATDGFTTTIAFTFKPDTYVAKAVATEIVASQASLSLAGTKQGTVTAAVLPNNVKAVTTTYSSSDPSKLKVDARTGAYEGLAIGSANVIATIEGSDGLPYTSTAAITIAA